MVGFLQVSVCSLVFPDESPFVPDIGAAAATGGFVGGSLEGEERALTVGGGGIGMAHQGTDVIEVRLRGRGFFEFDGRPFRDELLWGHGDGYCGRVA